MPVDVSSAVASSCGSSRGIFPSGIGTELGPAIDTELHGSPPFHPWIQLLIPAAPTVRADDRTVGRTHPTSMTSSKSMRRASSRLSGSGLWHSSKRAGCIHISMAFLRAKRSFFKGSGNVMQRVAKSRMLVKPHRVERFKIEDHSSKLCLSKVL